MTHNPSIQEYGDIIVDAIKRFGGGGLESYADHGFRAERILPPERRKPWPLESTECIWIPPAAGTMAMRAANVATSMDELFRLLHIAVRLGALRANTSRREQLDAFDIIFLPSRVKLLEIREEPIDPHMLAEAKKLVLAGYRFDERADNVIIPEESQRCLHCGGWHHGPVYKLTQEQARVFWAAFVQIKSKRHEDEL